MRGWISRSPFWQALWLIWLISAGTLVMMSIGLGVTALWPENEPVSTSVCDPASWDHTEC